MPEKLVARIDLREAGSTERIRGLERAALESGAIEGWAQRELAARPSATSPPPPSTSGRISLRPKRANLDTNNRGADFDERLAKTDPAATFAARNLAEWARSRGWDVHTKGDTSRLFLPPQPTRGETGLRIHFESFEHEPAVEFDLATLRSHGRSTEADGILAALAKLAGRRLTPKFPSLSCSVVSTRWGEVREKVLDPYASARNEL